MLITNNGALKLLNSFAIDAYARRIIVIHTQEELFMACQQAAEDAMPVLMLGGGSNVLFLENYVGTVLLNRITGLAIKERSDAWYLHVGAGEVWHNLVRICLKKHMPGLENLAFIPGYVGSAPIQNIGAYGVELRHFCEYVDVLQLATGAVQRLSATECQFSYRESIFKHALRESHAIIAVGLRLTKSWKPVLTYGDLSRLDPQKATQQQIYDAVYIMRRGKLPNPALQGNAGSFFKNPVIDAERAKTLLSCYPNAPHYPQPGGKVKLAAGWLIDRCGLKGYRLYDAVVYDKQVLVLVNADNATGKNIAELARYVRKRVAEQFTIWLEPEVRFIDANGEVDAVRVLT